MWKCKFVANICLVVMKNTCPTAHWSSDSMESINNTTALQLSMQLRTGSSYLPGAIQALGPPPFLFKCFQVPDSDQYLKSEFRNDE